MNIVQLQEIAVVALRRLAVLAGCVVLAVVALLPIDRSGIMMAAAPMVALSVLVFWMLARPEDVPAGLMFCAGLVFDAVGGGPLGLWALSFVIGAIGTRMQRDDILMMPRLVVILVYAVIAGFAAAAAWGIAAIYVQGLIDPTPVIAGAVISVATFLAVSVLLGARVPVRGRLLGPG